jgi:hypothetical protein
MSSTVFLVQLTFFSKAPSHITPKQGNIMNHLDRGQAIRPQETARSEFGGVL